MLAAVTAVGFAIASATDGPPVVPSAFIAAVKTQTNGTVPGMPSRSQAFELFYDHGNKRQRKDFGDGTTRVYRYDKMVDPPLPPVKGEPIAPTPMGFKFRTNDPDQTCCWLWLWDPQTQMSEKMFHYEIDERAKDLGPDASRAGAEHWQKTHWFPFKSGNDWWTTNGTLVAVRSASPCRLVLRTRAVLKR